MYIWKVWFDEQWTDTPDGEWEYNDEEYNVAAATYEKALEKAEDAAMLRSFTDENNVKHTIKNIRLVKIQREMELDA